MDLPKDFHSFAKGVEMAVKDAQLQVFSGGKMIQEGTFTGTLTISNEPVEPPKKSVEDWAAGITMQGSINMRRWQAYQPPTADIKPEGFYGPGFYREQRWSPRDSWYDRNDTEIMVLAPPPMPFHTDWRKSQQWPCVQYFRGGNVPYAFTVCSNGQEPFRAHVQLGTRLGGLDWKPIEQAA